MPRFQVACFALALSLSPATLPLLAQNYAVKDLGTLGGNWSLAKAINNNGQVAGAAADANGLAHAFLYSSGKMKDLGTLGGEDSIANSLNAAGVAAGYSETADGYSGFVFRHGQLIPITGLSSTYSTVQGINRSGQVTGQSINASGQPASFFFSNGQVTDLGSLGDDKDGTYAEAINASAQIVGLSYRADGNFRGFLWQAGAMTDLGTLGGDWSVAYGINDAGQITGVGYTPKTAHAFLYSNGKMQDIDKRSNLFESVGEAINQSGVVVGEVQVKGNGGSVNFHAFVFSHGKMLDLNKLIPADSGWILKEASGINDAGQIVGWGYHNKRERAFLLTPQ